MSRPDLIASYFTVAGDLLPHAPSLVSPIALEERVAVAARAGFTGMGFHFADAEAGRARLGDAGMRALLADHDMRWIELEALLDWFADGERGARSHEQRRIALDQAEALGAFQIKVAGDLAGDWPIDRMAEAFAMLCDEAAERGARVTIELLPFSNLATVARGLAVVGGHANGGLMFDAWHVARGHIPLADIAALAPGLCRGVELNDGAATPEMPDFYDDTIYCRRFPGEGAFDLRGLISATRAAGYTGPCGVEILSNAHRALSVEEAAKRAFESAAALFAT
jgi:sugar phosphate isomerase/epimerase